jgi:hypothetical protein
MIATRGFGIGIALSVVVLGPVDARAQGIPNLHRYVRIAPVAAPFERTAPAAVAWPLSPQAPPARIRSWIAAHPVLFGAAVGFGTGFLIGYLPGDDGVFDDFTAGFNGWVMGGIGAGTGALIGVVVGR